MVKDKNLFTLEKEILLIQLVQSRPILWDPTIEEYKRADKKRGKWDEIVAAMGPGYTGKQISMCLHLFRCLLLAQYLLGSLFPANLTGGT